LSDVVFQKELGRTTYRPPQVQQKKGSSCAGPNKMGQTGWSSLSDPATPVFFVF